MQTKENAENPLEALLAALAGAGDREQSDKNKARILAVGYTLSDYKTFRTLRHNLPALAEAAGCACAIAENTDHLPSAQFALEASKYMRGAARFMYGVLNKAGIDPSDYQMKPDDGDFYTALDGADQTMQAIIAKHDLAAKVAAE